MRWLRLFLKDRPGCGMLAAWLIYALLLQGLLAGIGQAAMAAGGGTICTPAGLAGENRPGAPLRTLPDSAHACCPALCQQSGGPAAALPPVAPVPAAPDRQAAPASLMPRSAEPAPCRTARLPEPRAPPRAG